MTMISRTDQQEKQNQILLKFYYFSNKQILRITETRTLTQSHNIKRDMTRSTYKEDGRSQARYKTYRLVKLDFFYTNR